MIQSSLKHQEISDVIKNVHEELRKSSQMNGATKAWEDHIKNDKILKNYAEAMKTLADIWEVNACDERNQKAKSRIKWIIEYCNLYFFTEKLYYKKRIKEECTLKLCHSEIYDQISNCYNIYLKDVNNLNILDVGSCFNPLKNVKGFNVTALDLFPYDKTVYKADFLSVKIEKNLIINEIDNEIITLPNNYYHCVIFSLLLEYLPSSEQRIECCKKAYDLLQYEGILIIITPDSNYVGKNAKLMKNWRYTLGKIGFSRIKFEKFAHITCLVLRKSINKMITENWSILHKEDYMTFSLEIPQDKEK